MMLCKWIRSDIFKMTRLLAWFVLVADRLIREDSTFHRECWDDFRHFSY